MPVADQSTHTFLRALWPQEPLSGWLVLWTKSKEGRKASTWCTTLAEAADAAARVRQDCDVYFGAALQDQDKALAIARRENPSAELRTVRGSSASSVAIPGLWADVDVLSLVHKHKNLPPDVPTALSLLEAIPAQPTMIVNSGHGLHVYWLFREPCMFASDEDRTRAASLLARLQSALRAAATKRGWRLDATADLARVLRLPGTYNHKQAP